MQQEEAKIEDSGSSSSSSSCPSFSCYSSDSLSSMAVAKVIREQQTPRFHDFEGVVNEEDDFEFLVLNDDDEQDEIDFRSSSSSSSWTVFPVFNRDFKAKNDEEIDVSASMITGTLHKKSFIDEEESSIVPSVTVSFNRDLKPKNDEIKVVVDHRREMMMNNKAKNHEIIKIDVSDSISGTLRKLFIDEHESSSSSSSSFSSSESDELENVPSGTYCVWRPNYNNNKSDEKTPKCNKSNSTGSGSNNRWRIRYLLRRSNSEGNVKHKRNSGEGSRTSGRLLKSSSPASHERFYVQKRAENEMVKRKSYLPYRQDLVGLFVNHNNRMGKMLPF